MIKSFYIKDDQKFTLKGNEDAIITLVLMNETINLEYELQDGQYQILIYNQAQSNIKIQDEGFIKNANVEITYLELNDFDYDQKSHIEVLEAANLKVHSIYLSNNEKNIHFDIVNQAAHTNVEIDNSAVCLKDSFLSLKVEGSIVKGAHGSTHFQRSHCLTVEKPKKAFVAPILNIDENDVQASHSLTSGTIDEEILYYMNARGLSRSHAILLMIQSYLLPDEEFFKQFELGLQIKEEVEGKVLALCSM